MSACIVFDIDGTLADCSQRLHHIQKSPPDWDSFFAETEKDEPIMVFEDRKRVADMWRSKGIRCCQVAPGDY